eukprot:TRINITY_DN15992_c0_g1::TRINITY_DN15992_c0_g1_i2::g.3812::m.3812 TRINITY_DN15992_c0_g1::TRINITY_DN15992_c0_g1_i2::g.3812  ORF type:complete len:271 (+),score=22.40,sp/Q7XP59/GLR31_ORYSJ/28.64/1e-20,ANF_receptor/PF01094.23/5.3e-38,Peripla_BP_6/PF13458.1/5.2e-10 TRINITY_DN15992_c0_g1_i2:97-909(+)
MTNFLFFLHLFIFVSFIPAFHGYEAPEIITIGVLVPLANNLDDDAAAFAAQLVVNEFNANSSIFPDSTIQIYFNSTESEEGSTIFSTMWQCEQDTYAVIGDSTSEFSKLVAYVSEQYHIPQISHAATSELLSDKTKFPYFSRTAPPDSFQGKCVADLVAYFGWNKVGVMFTADDYAGPLAQTFSIEAMHQNITILIARGMSAGIDPTSALLDVKTTGASVIALFAQDDVAATVLATAYGLGMTGDGIVWLGHRDIGGRPAIGPQHRFIYA